MNTVDENEAKSNGYSRVAKVKDTEFGTGRQHPLASIDAICSH